jgi:hypothetical protein
MSYDFKSGDGGVFSAYPNPFKTENLFLLAGALVFLAGGFICVLRSREFFSAVETPAALASSGLGIFLIGLGVKLLISALSQLRFWMGQHYPVGLAGSPSEGSGYGLDSQLLTETLRQQALSFPEPKGPLNGILYSLVRRLIVAPPLLQQASQHHFAALCNATIVLITMGISWSMFSGHQYEGLMSWFYLPLSGYSLYQLVRQRTAPDLDSSRVIKHGFAVAVFAVLATVLLPMAASELPAIHLAPMWSVCLAVQLGTIVTSGLFIAAVNAQIDAAEQTGVACEMQNIDMNCMPAQVWTEIERVFQRGWVQEIPNRQYIKAAPKTHSGDRGDFRGEILEESQPMPKDRMVFSSAREALKTKRGRVLIAMSTFGCVLVALSAMMAIRFSVDFQDQQLHEIWQHVLLVIATASSAVASISHGHLLWSRMHFTSKITWIEMDGTFQRSSIDIGNTFRSNVKSSSTITRIEDATIRVWIAELESVVFGKDSTRAVIAMRPVPQEASALVQHLQRFSSEQSSVAVALSSKDNHNMKQVLLTHPRN